MKLRSLLLLGAALVVTSTPHAKIVVETNITTLVSVLNQIPTDQLTARQKTSCTGNIQLIDCFSIYTKSSSDDVIEGPSSSHVEPSSSSVPSTKSTAPNGAPTSTATSTSTIPTDPLERQRVCFTGLACSPLFSNLTASWKKIHADRPMYEQDKEFATVYCDQENLKMLTDAGSRVMWDCRACSEVNSRATELWDAFSQALRGFCESPARSVYTLSKQILAFKKAMVVDPLGVQPAGFDPVVEHMVAAWDRQGVNGTGSYAGMKTATGTQALTLVLPRTWPYTRAAVARRPGMTARFTVTGRNGGAQAVVMESMVW
ncbi:hypothetical protein PMIN05_009018 [Paraphaeosphaeria minitans]